ncbi:MAG: hypothetical protein AW07_04313 [Candidatus Accumulibacter sp. SK-11]|nr:MAG: hypothetical protein AW07_04313 [Candidatus Accumulibacter sp. SK-11]
MNRGASTRRAWRSSPTTGHTGRGRRRSSPATPSIGRDAWQTPTKVSRKGSCASTRGAKDCRSPRNNTPPRSTGSIVSAPGWRRWNSACTSRRPIAGTRSARCRSSPAAASAWRSSGRRCRFRTPGWSPTSRWSWPNCAGAAARHRPACRRDSRSCRASRSSGGRCSAKCSRRRRSAPRRTPAAPRCSSCSSACRRMAGSTTGCAGTACSTASRCGSRCRSRPAGRTPSRPCCASGYRRCLQSVPMRRGARSVRAVGRPSCCRCRRRWRRRRRRPTACRRASIVPTRRWRRSSVTGSAMC